MDFFEPNSRPCFRNRRCFPTFEIVVPYDHVQASGSIGMASRCTVLRIIAGEAALRALLRSDQLVRICSCSLQHPRNLCNMRTTSSIISAFLASIGMYQKQQQTNAFQTLNGPGSAGTSIPASAFAVRKRIRRTGGLVLRLQLAWQTSSAFSYMLPSQAPGLFDCVSSTWKVLRLASEVRLGQDKVTLQARLQARGRNTSQNWREGCACAPPSLTCGHSCYAGASDGEPLKCKSNAKDPVLLG